MKKLYLVLSVIVCLVASSYTALAQEARVPPPAQTEEVVGYEIEEHPNPFRITIHLKKRVSNELHMTEGGRLLAPHPGFRMPPLMQDLLKVDGVTEVSLDGYEVTVARGQAFDWPEVIPNVLETIRKHVAPNGKLQEVQRSKKFEKKKEPPARPRTKTGLIIS